LTKAIYIYIKAKTDEIKEEPLWQAGQLRVMVGHLTPFYLNGSRFSLSD